MNLSIFKRKFLPEIHDKYRVKITERVSGAKSFMPQYHTGNTLDAWTNILIFETADKEFAVTVVQKHKDQLALERSIQIKSEDFLDLTEKEPLLLEEGKDLKLSVA